MTTMAIAPQPTIPHSVSLAVDFPRAIVFAIVAVTTVVGSAVYLLVDAVRGDHGHPFLEADASIMFAGWFAAGVSLQLTGTPWTCGGVVALPWLVVCSLGVASLVLVVVGLRVDRSITLRHRGDTDLWRTHD